MDWKQGVIGLEVSLALMLALRVLMLELKSVRRALLFFVIPTIATPIVAPRSD
jgi:hypothetical protein